MGNCNSQGSKYMMKLLFNAYLVDQGLKNAQQ